MTAKNDNDKEVMFIGDKTNDGGNFVIRKNESGDIRFGMVKPIKDGQHINNGSIVILDQIEGNKYQITDEYVVSTSKPSKPSKPSMVNSPEFKTGWEAIWGKN